MDQFNNHTFVVCAYKESKYLEECIKSLLEQTIKSNIIIATATPNNHIEKLAKKYNLKLFINDEKPGIGTDWNYGVSQTNTDYVTVAHQDDIYKKNYLEEIIKCLNKNSFLPIHDGPRSIFTFLLNKDDNKYAFKCSFMNI